MSARVGLDRSAWTLPLHPVILTAALVTGFWLDTTVSPAAAGRALLLGVVAAAALTLVMSLISRNRHLAAALVSGLVVVLYLKRILQVAETLGDRMPGWLLVAWVALIGLVILLAARLLMRGRSWTWALTTARLNAAALLLLAATIASSLFRGDLIDILTADRAGAVELPDGASANGSGGPDTYIVLLDGYPRADVLEHVFGYDNEGFLADLEVRGFEVAANSHSDYLWTHVSLASMLHMEYIEQIESLAPVVEGSKPNHPSFRRAVNRNPTFEFLRERGYRIVAIPAGYDELALRGADEYMDNGSINEFELKLLTSTYLGDLIAAVAPDFASSSHRARITDEFDALADAAGSDRSEPQLVFAHVPAPHQPTVFGRDGEPIPVPLNEHFYSDSPLERGVNPDQWVVDYRHQLDHLNGLIIEAVDDIIEASDEPPVIVLWSDHGSSSRVDWVVTQPREANPVDLLERTGTLFASLTPNREAVFPDDITPVNTFRYLFDAYFGTQLGAAEAPAGGGQIPPVDGSVLDE
jgi:hypothetical protein